MNLLRKWFILAVASVGNFTAAAVYSLQAPFFPVEAEMKGVTPSGYGVVFGAYQLTILLCSPIIGSKLSTIGVKFCMCCGILITATSCTLFGTLPMIKDSNTFLYFAIAIRITEGIGQCAFSISILTVVSVIFPESANDKMAVVISAFTVGMIASPAIGGALYSVGGFGLPFYVVGASLYVISVFCIMIMVDIEKKPEKNASIMKCLLKCSDVWLALLPLFIIAISMGFMEAVLEPHLRQFNFSMLYISLFFMISPATQCLFMRIIGRLVDKGVSTKKIMIFGIISMIICFALVGPFPWIPLDSNPYLIGVGLLFRGLAISKTLTPCFGEILRIATKLEFSKDENCNGAISGLYTTCMSSGIFVGPIIGGILLQFVGFRKGTLFPISLNVLCLIILLSVIVKQWKRSSEFTERSKLIESSNKILIESSHHIER